MAIPILMYHEVNPGDAVVERYTVSIERFSEQLAYLRDHGYRSISLAEYRELVAAGGVGASGNEVVITFDDNNLSHYTVSLPLLAEFGFQATFFVVSGFINTQNDFLTREHLREMKRAGMAIESHSHSHRFLSDLDDEDLREELVTSRSLLSEYTGEDVRFVSCPGGRYSRRVLDVALDAGYHAVCTSMPGLNSLTRPLSAEPLNRFLVLATTPIDAFAKIVSGEPRFVRGRVLRSRLTSTLKRVIGNRVYDRLWQRYRRAL